jgi:hypothetical protein
VKIAPKEFTDNLDDERSKGLIDNFGPRNWEDSHRTN